MQHECHVDPLATTQHTTYSRDQMPTDTQRNKTTSSRETAIKLYLQGWSSQDIADLGIVSCAARSIRRWIKDYKDTGLMMPFKVRPWALRRHYSAFALRRMDTLLAQSNGLKAKELRVKLWQQTGEAASLRTVNRMIKLLKWRRKRLSTLSRRRNPETMQAHAEVRELFHPRQLLFADETHKRGRDLRRRYGYGKENAPATVPLSPHLGRSWTVLACFDWTGFVDWSIQELAAKPTARLPKAVDRELWMLMFRESVLPHLQPCDARMLPRSVLVIDNCSLHWKVTDDDINELEREVKSVGAQLLYIPQYCPRANAIEAGFAQMNHFIEEDIELADQDPERAIHEALLQIDTQYGSAFVRRSICVSCM